MQLDDMFGFHGILSCDHKGRLESRPMFGCLKTERITEPSGRGSIQKTDAWKPRHCIRPKREGSR